MSEVISPSPQAELRNEDCKNFESEIGHEKTSQEESLQRNIDISEKVNLAEKAVEDPVPDHEPEISLQAEAAGDGPPKTEGATSTLNTISSTIETSQPNGLTAQTSSDASLVEVEQCESADQAAKSSINSETSDGPSTEEELAIVTGEKAALDKQRLPEKEVRGLNKVLIECKNTAQDIKGDVLKVLQERKSCEEECLEIERNIGEKLAALTADVHKSAKECSEPVIEEVEAEPRTPVPVTGGPSVSGRDRRANSKSATPPPADRISQDISKQEPSKKLSAGSKKKAVESVLRSLGNFETAEDKLRALCELHYETLEQLRETQAMMDKWKKQFQASQKETNRSLLARDRLEGLCRELQKHNNAIKEESALRRREEEEKRKHIAAKFQTTLTDISALMADTQETSAKLRQDNAQLASKLRTLVNHYDLWEKHSENMLKQKTIEAELAMAKLREAQLLREKDVTEVEHSRKLLETAAKEMQSQLETSLRNELMLREQLKLHNDKYEEFQEAIVSSNKMFTDFRGEVESMGKQTRKFEKDALQWKQRWEEANLATARVFQEKTKSDLKVETLSRLCRSLQDKLRISNQEMAELESGVAGEVVAEERAKLERELAKKQGEIEEHKQALEARKNELQVQTMERIAAAAEKVSTEMEQTLNAKPCCPPAESVDNETPLTAPLNASSEENQEQPDKTSNAARRDNKKKNKKKHC